MKQGAPQIGADRRRVGRARSLKGGRSGLVICPFRCHEFRGKHQDDMSVFLKPAFHPNAADFTAAQGPFVIPDVEFSIAKAYGQFACPILLHGCG
jgi:hypothetical protein